MNGIGIEVGGEWLDLSGVKIRVKAASQLFARDFVQNWFTYPIALPRTNTNAQVMRHYDRLANTADLEDIPCNIHLGGLFWKAGLIVYRGYQRGVYDIDIKVPPDPIITELSERLLSSFDYDGPYSFEHTPDYEINEFQAIWDSHLGDIDATPFIFAPIRNVGKFGDRDENYFGNVSDPGVQPPHNYLNYYDPNLSEPWFYYTNDAGIENWFNDYTPLPYLAFIVEHIFEALGWTLEGDVFDNEEVRTMVIVPNFYMMLLVETVGGVFAATENDQYNSLDLGKCLPNMTCIEFLRALMGRFNAAPIWSGGNRVEFRSMNDVLASGDYLDITDRIVPDFTQRIDRPASIKVEAEVEPLDKEQEENLDFDDAHLAGTATEPSGLSGLSPDAGDYGIAQANNKVYQYQFDGTTTDWRAYADYLYNYEEAEDAEAISAGVAFMAMYWGEDEVHGSRNWLVPLEDVVISDHMGNWHGMGINDVQKLRLLFYRGMQPDSNADNYPLLSNERFDYAGNAITDANMAERISGEGGIYETWYSQWREALRTSRSVQVQVRMGMQDLMQFDFGRKLRIHGVDHLAKSFDVEVRSDGMGLVLLELMSL